MSMKTKKVTKTNYWLAGIIVLVLLIGGVVWGITAKSNKDDSQNENKNPDNVVNDDERETETKKEIDAGADIEADVEASVDSKDEETVFEVDKSLYYASNNTIDMVDLYFMKVENKKENKIYSPLSVKYALSMLAEGAKGDAQAQILDILGEYTSKKYVNSEKLSLANAFFVNDTYKDNIKKSYVDTLMDKYDAEVRVESFSTPESLNEWVKEKSLGLIENIVDDISGQDILLVNTLAIDMVWKDKFANKTEDGMLYDKAAIDYMYYGFGWSESGLGEGMEFEGERVDYVSLTATYNKYDIINELGEEKIKEILKSEAKDYLQENPGKDLSDFIWYGEVEDKEKLSVDQQLDFIIDKYLKELDTYYMDNACSTEFAFYTDDSIKVLAKDLEDVDGVSLQYIGIMPVEEELNDYVKNVTANDITYIINNLKEANSDNFKDGVITKIHGAFPKFKFGYELDLINDLNKLGITNVFEKGKANLSNMSEDSSLYITDAKQTSKIDFNEDGIKAASVTMMGGKGGGGDILYIFEPPVEEIDLTFDKPFMFIIRDKNSGEVWFAGNVYEGVETEYIGY